MSNLEVPFLQTINPTQQLEPQKVRHQTPKPPSFGHVFPFPSQELLKVSESSPPVHPTTPANPPLSASVRERRMSMAQELSRA